MRRAIRACVSLRESQDPIVPKTPLPVKFAAAEKHTQSSPAAIVIQSL